MKQMWSCICPELLSSIEREPEEAVVPEMMESFAKVIFQFYEGFCLFVCLFFGFCCFCNYCCLFVFYEHTVIFSVWKL